MQFFLFLHQDNEIIQNDSNSLNIWIPMYNEVGHSPHFYRRAMNVVKDDLLFHYKRGYISGISVVLKKCISVDKAFPLGLCEEVGIPGYQLKTIYYQLEKPIRIRDYLKDISTKLPDRYVAFQPTGHPNEGAFYPCPIPLAEFFIKILNPLNLEQQSTITEIAQSIKARLRQQQYREKQLKLWDTKCALCEIDHPDFLRASHAKPWKECDNTERLDPYNGLLLCVLHDASFDQGYITFSPRGMINISNKIELDKYVHYNLSPNQQITLEQKHQPYMAYHRENVFQK